MQKTLLVNAFIILFAIKPSVCAQNSDLNNNSSISKAHQIEVILQAKDTSVITRLKPFLTDEDWYVRGIAGRAIGATGDKESLILLKPLLQDSNWFVREIAVESLANLGDLSVVSSLEKLI